MKLLILVSTFIVSAICKPQYYHNIKTNNQAVQIQKQEIREVTPVPVDVGKRKPLNTQEIIDKIIEVNMQHGLTPKGIKMNHNYADVLNYRAADARKQQILEDVSTPASFTSTNGVGLTENSEANLRKDLSGNSNEKALRANFHESSIVPTLADVRYFDPQDASIETRVISAQPQVQYPYYPYIPYQGYEVQYNHQWQWPFPKYAPVTINSFQQYISPLSTMQYYGETNEGILPRQDKSGNGINLEDHNVEQLQFTSGRDNSTHLTLKLKMPTEFDRSIKNIKQEEVKKLPSLPEIFQFKPTGKPSEFGGVDVYTKDNIGNGVYVNKIKVRKGGVAIAGPGGIATAGSGGTAIVGPNGYAYTHPDSVAIAGAGTKVIAVDPEINLIDLVKSINRTGVNSRVGKIVAVGPVVYYNEGWAFLPLIPEPTLQLTTPLQYLRMMPQGTSILDTSEKNKLKQRIALSTFQDTTKSDLSNIENLQKLPNENVDEMDLSNNIVIPYKAHPLFNYLKSMHNVQNSMVFRFRNTNNGHTNHSDIATLILKPVANALAGEDGKAIASPLSRAIIRNGVDTDILYEPAAVAIAGPGGIAHAQSDLEIFFEE